MQVLAVLAWAQGDGRMSSAEEYRALAEQCFALAQKAADPQDKARLIQMAQSWRELADRVEQRGDKDPAKKSAKESE